MKLLLALLLVASTASGQVTDSRYCGTPERRADGTIKRSKSVLRWFQILHPCPATALTSGPCEGWAKDHVIPLACGGCDAITNLQWLPREVKALKDGFEREIYGTGIPGTELGCPLKGQL